MLASVMMPLLTALLLSLLLEQPVTLLERLYGNRRVAAAVVFGAAVAVLLGVVGLGVSRLFAEAENLLAYLHTHAVPEVIGGIPLNLETALADYGMELLAALTDVLRATPELLLSFCVTMFATYYLLCEPDLPLRAMCVFVPERLHSRLQEVYGQTLMAFAAYLRAQAAVMLQTFVLSLLGLKLLGVNYVLLFGVLIALLDLLPMVGPGTLLLPWAMLEGLQGDERPAVGLLLLLAAIIIGRQIVEPKIMGAGLGLHPLASLLAGFLGLAVLGPLGLLLGPLIAGLVYFVYTEK